MRTYIVSWTFDRVDWFMRVVHMTPEESVDFDAWLYELVRNSPIADYCIDEHEPLSAADARTAIELSLE